MKAKFQGIPSFFRGLCHEARAGGNSGYKTAGYELARHCCDLIEADTDEEIDAKIEELAKLVLPIVPGDPPKIDRDLRDDSAVLAWFRREFPKCMKLVPGRRQGQFLLGIYEAVDDEAVFEG